MNHGSSQAGKAADFIGELHNTLKKVLSTPSTLTQTLMICLQLHNVGEHYPLRIHDQSAPG